MKIQKVIFSSSEQYSDFWNLQSKIWKKTLNIEPVCLLFGKKSNTDMTEEFGKVHEMNFITNLPKILQITFSKFYYTKMEPDTVWMTGDLDQFPLSRSWWTDNILDVGDDEYAHLNVDGCGSSIDSNKEQGAWLKYGMRDSSNPSSKGIPLPAHYHVFRGNTFVKVYGDMSFEDHVKEVINIITPEHLEHKKNDPQGYRTPNDEPFYWTAEETYTSTVLWEKVRKGIIKFHGRSFLNKNDTQAIDKSHFGGSNYIYNLEKLKSGQYIHLHSARGFGQSCNDQNWFDKSAKKPLAGFAAYAKQTTDIIRMAGMIE